jgi:hypothetical protein
LHLAGVVVNLVLRHRLAPEICSCHAASMPPSTRLLSGKIKRRSRGWCHSERSLENFSCIRAQSP